MFRCCLFTNTSMHMYYIYIKESSRIHRCWCRFKVNNLIFQVSTPPKLYGLLYALWGVCVKAHTLLTDNTSKIGRYFVKYSVETTRALSEALFRFVIYIRNYGGSGVSNPLTTLVGSNTPICFMLKLQGGTNGYIS